MREMQLTLPIEQKLLQMLFSVMKTEQIVALLVAERDRLSHAIDGLQEPIKRRGRAPGWRNATARPKRKIKCRCSERDRRSCSATMAAIKAGATRASSFNRG